MSGNPPYMLSHFMQAAGVTNCPLWMHGIPMKYRPFDHQLDSLREMLSHERFGEYSDAGTGKTLPMQGYATLYAALGNRAVVVMPPSLIEQFLETFHEFFVGIENHIKIAKLKGTPKQREKLIAVWDSEGWPDVLVMSYQMFLKHSPPRKKVKSKERVDGRLRVVARTNPMYRFLQNRGYNALIADEAHALKNPGTETHKAFWHYVGDGEGEHALVLATGSPIGNTPIDAYGLIRLVTPEAYRTKGAFERDYVIFNPNSDFREILGYQNLEKMHEVLYKQARRVTKQEVFKDLQEPLVAQVPVQLSPKHKKLYQSLLKERVLLLQDKLIDATQETALRMAALRLLSCPEHYSDEPIDNELRRSIDAIVEGIDPSQHKIIMFSYFKETVAALSQHYAHLNPAVINGASGDKDPQRLKFLNDPSCRMIIVNWLSGGVGLNLQISSHVVFAEAPTVPKDAHQAIARAHRSGQKEVVNVYFFKVPGTLAAKNIKKLLSKEVENNEVVRDKHKLLAELLGD